MTSRYAQHILDTQHAYATMEDTLDILHIERKGPLMNTLERFHIYKLSKENMHMNHTYGDMYNKQTNKQTNSHGLSPRANYTDRATAAFRRSDCQLLRIKGATWSA
jgi:hypothetical protein